MQYLGINITDWIEAGVAVITMLATLVSLWQSFKALALTRESIKSTSRPYISMYVERIDTVAEQKYIVIKNFGNSAATIESLSFDKPLDQFNTDQLQSIVGTSIAPGQKFTSAVMDDFNDLIVVAITYRDLESVKYREKHCLKFDAHKDFAWTKSNRSDDGDIAKAIRHSTQAILKSLK